MTGEASHLSGQAVLPAELPSGRAGTGRQKLLFVGDNRSAVNWGRGASVALHQLLSSVYDVAGCVGGELFDLSNPEVGYVGTTLPPRYYHWFRWCWLRRYRRPFSWYVRLEEMLGARDFIAEDPAVSVERLLGNLDRHPVLKRIYDQAIASDFFLLDGDGDIIFSTPPRRHTLFLLAMIQLGIRLGKPVVVANSMISDCPLTGRNVETLAATRLLFAQCSAVTLRDPQSLEYVQREMPETNASFFPDSLFSWYPLYAEAESAPAGNGDFLLPWPESEEAWGKLRFDQPYICIGGGAMAGTQPDLAAACCAKLVDGLRYLGYRVILTESDLPDSFLRMVAREKKVGLVPATASILQCGAVLAHARLFISGRYHPSIFAALGGTPCIFLGSHAHKMGSLSRVLEYDRHREFSAFPGEDEIAEMIATAESYLKQGDTLRTRIRGVAKMRCEQVCALPTYLQQELNY